MLNKKEDKKLAIAYSFAWEIGYSIIFPLIFLALSGRLLDRRFGTGPFLFAAGVILSIFITTYIIVKKSMKIMESVNKKTDNNKNIESKEENKNINKEEK